MQLLLALALGLLSLTNDYQSLPAEVTRYIPPNYQVLNVTYGNLNLDNYPDLILVLHKNNEEKTSDVVSHPEKRPLLIFTGGPGNTYKLTARNDNAVYCVDCGGAMGDPFTGITIKNGYFSVEHYGGSAWRWARIITFRYVKTAQNWVLYKDGNESFNAGDPEKVERKIYTAKKFGKVPFNHFNIYKE
jgi:hypothetical protein